VHKNANAFKLILIPKGPKFQNGFFGIFTRRKTDINDSINNSFLSRLGLKLPINDSNNVFGFELLWESHLCHLSRLCTRGYFSSKG
jgi:hypothetical protein